MTTHTTIICDFCKQEIFTEAYVLKVEQEGPGVTHKEKKYDLHKECAKSIQTFIEIAERRGKK